MCVGLGACIRCLGQQVVDAPLGWEPVIQRLRRGPVHLLDPGTIICSPDFRVHHAGVLGHFAEEVLAVDQLEGPSPQGMELQSQPFELLFLPVRDKFDDVCLVEAAEVAESLADAVQRPGSRYNKLHLGKIANLAVIQIGHELVAQEVPDSRV